MLANTMSKNAPDSEKDVFAPTVPEIKGETCDACGGGAAVARYSATREGKTLYFCAHHARKHSVILKVQGYTLHPSDISFTAALAS